MKVWKELLNIPYGETCTYKDIATRLGNPKACRAVGGANNKNPIMIIIPCHRVVGKNGDLVGYACGLDVKSKLLEIEKETRNHNLWLLVSLNIYLIRFLGLKFATFKINKQI